MTVSARVVVTPEEHMLACVVGPIARVQDAHGGLSVVIPETIPVVACGSVACDAADEPRDERRPAAETFEWECARASESPEGGMRKMIAAPVLRRARISLLLPQRRRVVGDRVLDERMGCGESAVIPREIPPGRVSGGVFDVRVDCLVLFDAGVRRAIVEVQVVVRVAFEPVAKDAARIDVAHTAARDVGEVGERVLAVQEYVEVLVRLEVPEGDRHRQSDELAVE